MVEMFEVMAEIEGFCGRLAARRMNPSERKNLFQCHRKCLPYVKTGDREGYHALNKPFHEAIYAGSHNRYLMDEAQSLYHRLAPYRAYQLQQPQALQRASQEHQQIVDAIIVGDGDLAYKLLFDHVRLDSDLFSDLVAALNTSASTDKPPSGNGRLRL